MTSVRNKVETALLIVVVVYIMNLARQLILRSSFIGEILSYTIWGIAVALAGIGVLWVFMILHKIGNSKGELSESAKKILYWLAVIAGGTIAYRNVPSMFEWIETFIRENMDTIAYLPTTFVIRLTPFAIIGGYAGIVYASLIIMILAGLAFVVFDGGTMNSSVLTSIKVPITLSIIAITLSFINHELVSIYILWTAIFIMTIIGQHKTFVRAMGYVRYSEFTGKSGMKLYLSLRDISGTVFENIIDKIAVFVVVGLTLVMQIILIIAFIVFVTSNFSEMQNMILQWV